MSRNTSLQPTKTFRPAVTEYPPNYTKVWIDPGGGDLATNMTHAETLVVDDLDEFV